MSDTSSTVDLPLPSIQGGNPHHWQMLQTFVRTRELRRWAELNEADDAPARRHIEVNLDLTPQEAYAEAVALICPPPAADAADSL